MSVRDRVRSSRLTVVPYQPPNGESIWIRAFSGPARSEFGEYLQAVKDNGGPKAEVVAAMAISDESGTLGYDWKNPDDVAELVSHYEATVLDEIGVKLFEISGYGPKAAENAEKK